MKKAKVFISGHSQVIRLPKQFRVTGSEVYIKQVGDVIHLIPIKKDPWSGLEESLSLFDESFLGEGRSQPKLDKREKL